MKSERINPTKLNSEHMQIIGKCGTFGYKQITGEIFYEEMKKHGGELIKLGNHKPRKTKFSIGDLVETIPEYTSIIDPHVVGVITEIDDTLGSVDYLIGDTWIFEKWLKRVE